jgi:hypothetical protein
VNLGLILPVVLGALLVVALPIWRHSRTWGYFPVGGLALVLVIVGVLAMLGRI